MTPDQLKKLGAMGYFDSNKSKIDKEDIMNKLWDNYSELTSRQMKNNTRRLIVETPRLSEQGARKLIDVSDNNAYGIEVSIDSNMNSSFNKGEIMKELNEIRQATKDQAEYNLEERFGYGEPSHPKDNTERTAQKMWDSFNRIVEDDDDYDSNQKRVDFLQAKKILNESIDKTIDTAIREMPKE